MITIDKSDENLDMAKRFWSRAGVSHKVSLLVFLILAGWMLSD